MTQALIKEPRGVQIKKHPPSCPSLHEITTEQCWEVQSIEGETVAPAVPGAQASGL